MLRHVRSACGVAVCLVAAVSQAATINVPADQPTIQLAVTAATDGDTIEVAPGTYTEHVTVSHKDVVLLGDTSAFGVIWRPAAAGTPLLILNDIAAPSAQIVGFVIEHASGAPAVSCVNASPTIRKNHIRDNLATGIRVAGIGTAVIADNFIYRNRGLNGGGIALDEGGADVVRNVIDSNWAELGGAIFSDNRQGLAQRIRAASAPSFLIDGNVLQGNFALLGGGGIYLYEGFPVTITGNLFVDDTSNFGGGIDNSGRSFVTVTGNTFDRCVSGIANGGGNAIWWAEHATVGGAIKNNVVTNTNSPVTPGGGIGCDANIVGLVDLDYNAVWNNTPQDYYRFLPGPHSLGADPLYCNAVSGDYHLDAGSPCVGTGEGGVNRGAFGVGCGTGGPQVAYLAVQGGENRHIVDHAPTIAWGYFDPAGSPQVRFEIEVGTDDDWSTAEMWQPGPATGQDTSVVYSGAALADGSTYYVRLRVANGTAWGNWASTLFRMNTSPEAPALARPIGGQPVATYTPTLQVAAGTDREGDPQLFAFEVYTDAAMTTRVASHDFAFGWGDPTAWGVQPALPSEGQYWWRASASDGWEQGPWSTLESFIVDVTNDPPLPFALLSPPDKSLVLNQTPLLDWEDANDPDPGGVISSYTVTLATDSGFHFSQSISGLAASQYRAGALPFGLRYWWRVTAFDSYGLFRTTGTWSFVIPAPGDVNGDLRFDARDIVALVDIIFRGAPVPAGLLAADVNGDCMLDLRDVVGLINYIFRGSNAPTAVCNQQPPGGKKRCVPQDYPTIQAAVDAAASRDTVCVFPGTYAENVVVDGMDIVLIGDTVGYGVILHPTGPNQSPLSLVGNVSRAGEVIGLVITGGDGAPGIRCTGSSPTIRRNRIQDNSGHGILLTDGGLGLIRDNVISGNQGSWGGGISMQGGGADIIGNLFERNSAAVGGGVFGSNEPPHVISDNTFRGNLASGGGGGVYLIGEGAVTISFNLFVSDTSNHGGGLDNSGRDSVRVFNNTFDRCHAGLRTGGGNAIWWATGGDIGAVIKNNIITNTTTGLALGGAIGGDESVVSAVDVDFNTVWNNTPQDYYRFSPGVHSLAADPLYCDPGNSDYRLRSDSPCLGTGEGGTDRGAYGVGCSPP